MAEKYAVSFSTKEGLTTLFSRVAAVELDMSFEDMFTEVCYCAKYDIA